VKGIDSWNMEHFFELVDGDGHDLLRQGFFSQRVVCAWNSLSSSVVESSFMNIFKKRLDECRPDVDL